MMKKLLSLTFGLLFVLTSIAQSDGDYQSLTSASWDEATTWEVYNDLSGTWEPATTPPDPETMLVANEITIQAGHIVTYLPSGTILFFPQLTIESTGDLLVAGTASFLLFSTVVIDGVLITSATVDVSIGADGSMTINPSGTVTIGGSLANSSSLGVDGIVIKSTSETATGSLIHGSGIPLATVERYVPIDGWHFIGVPTTLVTAQDLYIDESNSSWLMKWDEPTQAWSYIVDPLTESLPLGSGYNYWWQDSPAREMTTPGTIEFKGNILDPTANLSIPLTNDGTGEGAGFNLIGNPWPASVAVDPNLVTDLTNCEFSVWIWNNDGGSGVGEDSGWFEWAAIGTPSGDNNNPLEQAFDIAVGQGFYLRAITGDGSGSSILFNGSARAHDTGAEFYKESEELSEDVNPLIQLLVSKNDKTDRAYIMFGENGSTGFENGYDVTKMFGGEQNSYVYLNEEDHDYAQNYLSELYETEERVVDVYVRPGTEGTHTFAVNMEYMPDVEVTLEDTQTDELVTMNNDVVYTFEATPGDSEDRFKMHFVRTVTGIENPGVQEDAVNIYAYNKAVYISNKDNSTSETAKVSIFDMYGREIYSTQSRLENNTRIPVNVSNSYLIVRVTKGNNTYTEKVFVK